MVFKLSFRISIFGKMIDFEKAARIKDVIMIEALIAKALINLSRNYFIQKCFIH